MNEIVGWLLDVYADSKDGVVLWLLGEDGKRYRLRHWLPITFYAAGPATRLRQLWCYLQSQPVAVNLERTQREDLFTGMRTVLAVQVPNAAAQERLFQEAARFFPDLDYYDADVPLALRYGAAYGIFPLARCRARVEDEGRLKEISPLDFALGAGSPFALPCASSQSNRTSIPPTPSPPTWICTAGAPAIIWRWITSGCC